MGRCPGLSSRLYTLKEVTFRSLQGLAALAALTLRNAKNADLAFWAKAADCAAEALESQPESFEVQRQACQLIRNLAVRNVENRCGSQNEPDRSVTAVVSLC